MNGWQLLLFPFAIIYDIVTRCRNWLYDVGFFASQSFPDLRIISVGNLAVGGTGKTPMVEYLVRRGLQMNAQLAVLSRGYGRSTKGVRMAKKGDTASDLGDESYGYFLQFGDRVKVVVAEKRVLGLAAIRQHLPNVQVVILDDAFQHRAVKTDFSVLLTNYARPFWSDYLMPSGRLREARRGSDRADLIVLTKCPENQDIIASEEWNYLNKMGVQAAATTVRYGSTVWMNGTANEQVIALAGLADNRPFFTFVKSAYSLLESVSFPDHKMYTEADVDALVQKAKGQDAAIITTFKDAVKLKSFDQMQNITWGYVPIETVFLAGEAEFLKKCDSFFESAIGID